VDAREGNGPFILEMQTYRTAATRCRTGEYRTRGGGRQGAARSGPDRAVRNRAGGKMSEQELKAIDAEGARSSSAADFAQHIPSPMRPNSTP